MNHHPKKLLDCVRDVLREKHYSIRTEQVYVDWIKRYILFHNKRHPHDMGAPEIEAFLIHLAVDLNVAASTQTQALSALLFLYRQVLEIDPGPVDAIRAKKPKHLPTVLTREEVKIVIAAISGTNQLITQLLYGAGLRLIECLRLRVQEIDFDYRQIIVRNRKGTAYHVTMLPHSLVPPLQEHLQGVKTLHRRDRENGYGAVYLPPAIEEKYPHAHYQLPWQYVFPAPRLSTDARPGIVRRTVVDYSTLPQPGREQPTKSSPQSSSIRGH